MLEDFIRNEAKRLGFAAVGFASAAASLSFGRFQEWLERGYAGEMYYLAKNAAARAHPAHIADYVKTIIVVAARYPARQRLDHWSNYAAGQDYHGVLRSKLQQLAQAIRKQSATPLQARICVDTAPLLEREWAARAGLGWIGKQGSLIHPQFGSCLFLGELLVNLELNPSQPMPSQCGDCRLCLEACPSGALRADGWLDARLCAAYLSIEYKGTIPDALQSAMSASLYGCDRCTAVCPYNPPDDDGILSELRESQQTLPAPQQCLRMTDKDFELHFTGSAVARLSRQRLQRNAAIVLKHSAR